MQVKHLTDQLTVRSIALSGNKTTLIEILSKALNDDAKIMRASKTATPFPAPKTSHNNINWSSNRENGREVAALLAWVWLEQDYNNTTADTIDVAVHNPTDRTQKNFQLTQRNNCSERHERKIFSNKKKKHKIGRNGRRMKDDYNNYVWRRTYNKEMC